MKTKQKQNKNMTNKNEDRLALIKSIVKSINEREALTNQDQ